MGSSPRCFLFLFIACSGGFSATCFSQEPAVGGRTVPRSEVLAPLRSWTDSVVNLEIRWKQHSDQDLIPSLGQDATREELDSYYTVSTFYWSKSGAWRYEASQYGNRKLTSHSAYGANPEEDLCFEGEFACEEGKKRLERLTLGSTNSNGVGRVLAALF